MPARSRRVEGASPPSRWLFGPIPDLIFGCGMAYLAVFVGLAVAGPDVTLWLPASILPLLTVVAGGPQRIIQNPVGAERIGEREWRRALARFSLSSVAHERLQVVEGALDRRARPVPP